LRWCRTGFSGLDDECSACGDEYYTILHSIKIRPMIVHERTNNNNNRIYCFSCESIGRYTRRRTHGQTAYYYYSAVSVSQVCFIFFIFFYRINRIRVYLCVGRRVGWWLIQCTAFVYVSIISC